VNDQKDAVVCHIDYLRRHRLRPELSPMGTDSKALQREGGRDTGAVNEDGAHADVTQD